MAQPDNPTIDWARVNQQLQPFRELHATDRFALDRFLMQVEQPADRIYRLPLRVGAKDYGFVAFQRWTREEVMRFHDLPFAAKITTGAALSEDETTQLTAFQAEMVAVALTDKTTHVNNLNDPLFIGLMFTAISLASGLDNAFRDALQQFLADERSFDYGYLWFVLLRKTPSEIALLPVTDVTTIQAWYQRWAERLVKSHV